MSGSATAERYAFELDQHVVGTVYLLHFDPPLRHAGHYLGWTAGDPDRRLGLHINGQASPLVRAVVAEGGAVSIVRLWEGVDRHFERALKARASTRLCPRCSPHPSEPRGPFCARRGGIGVTRT